MPKTGYLNNQGKCSAKPFESYPAGNHFRVTSSTIKDIYNGSTMSGFTFNYVYDNASGASVRPDINYGNVIVIGCGNGSTTQSFCASLPALSLHNEQQLITLIPNTTDPTERATPLSELLELLTVQDNEKEIIPFLQSDSALEAKKILIPLLIKEKRYVEARIELGNIPTNNEENTRFTVFHTLLSDLGEQNKTYDEIAPNQVQTVRDISNSQTTLKANAQAILGLVFKEEFPFTCEMVDNCDYVLRKQKPINEENFNNIIEKETLSLFEIAPNPAGNSFIIYYNTEELNVNNSELRIYDLFGKLVKNNILNKKKNTEEINCKDLKNGTYITALYSAGKISSYKKIIVLK